MVAITATLGADRPQVQLRITENDGFNIGADLWLTRTDHSGTRPVRLSTGNNAAATSLTVMDHEPALGPVLYHVNTYVGDLRDPTFMGTGDTAEVDVSTRYRLPTFSLPFRPGVLVTVPAVNRLDGPRASASVIHEIIGRTDPLATIRPLSGRTGTLQALVRSWSAVKDLEALLELGQVVHYREADNPGMDAYMVIQSTEPSQAAGRLWFLDVTYTEVAPPTGRYVPVQNRSTWNFDTVKGEYDRFPALTGVFDTFNDLTAGGLL